MGVLSFLRDSGQASRLWSMSLLSLIFLSWKGDFDEDKEHRKDEPFTETAVEEEEMVVSLCEDP